MYIALTYVDNGKQVYAPGEAFSEDPNAEWHLKVGAIRLANAEEAEAEEAVIEETAEETAEEAADEAEVSPEIDIMDGIVKKPTRKKSTRKAKGGDEA